MTEPIADHPGWRVWQDDAERWHASRTDPTDLPDHPDIRHELNAPSYPKLCGLIRDQADIVWIIRGGRFGSLEW